MLRTFQMPLVSVELNSVDVDQTTLFDQKASKIFQQMTKADNICYDWRFKDEVFNP